MDNISCTIQQLIDHVIIEFDELNKVLLNSSKSEKTNLLSQIVLHVISSKGKRIRPLLSIATAKLFKCDKETKSKILLLASAIEFIHTATLLHDDVVDNCEVRRNTKTANYVWGNKSSILVGDFLFAESFKQMIKTKNLKVLEVLSRVSADIAEAEVWQLELIGKLDITIENYINLITNKTANLFAATCECSSILANANQKQINALKNFGLNLGIIFQINDDICDYFGTNEVLGKKAGNDFFENKITLPVILVLKEAKGQDLVNLKNIFQTQNKTQDQFSQLMLYFEKYLIKKKSCLMLKCFVDKGITALNLVPKSKFKNMLIDLINSYTKLF